MIRPIEDGALLDILVSPRASRQRIGPIHGDRLKVTVTSPPVSGAANQAVIDLFARALKIPRSRIEIATGHASRRKTIRLRGVSEQTLRALVG